MQQARVNIHEPRRFVRRKVTTSGNWEPVAIARFLWPADLLAKLEAGEAVVFDGYDWQRVAAYPLYS